LTERSPVQEVRRGDLGSGCSLGVETGESKISGRLPRFARSDEKPQKTIRGRLPRFARDDEKLPNNSASRSPRCARDDEKPQKNIERQIAALRSR